VVGDTFLGLLDRMPSGAIAVAESGLGSDDDVRRLHAAGYPAFLIGEWLMRSDDPESRVRALTGGPR
jgi:indole-3-glycerol phosphate synthase